MLRFFFAAVVSLTLLPNLAHAEDTETLPAGVSSPQIRVGIISGLGETWGDDHNLYNLGETRSVPFDAQTLAKVNAQAQALINALNLLGTQGLGSQINLGTLNVNTQPVVTYYAPVFAYGINDKWTIGVGLPVVNYQNTIALSSSGSNLDFYRQQLGDIPAIAALSNLNLVTEAQKVLAAKGYLPLQNRNETYLADAQIAVMHRLPDYHDWSFMHETMFTLPTGPAYNPDDLMALNTFGRTSITNSMVAAYAVRPRWTIIPYTGLETPIPDQVSRRVPVDENDLLPDANTKQNVMRYLGMTTTLGADLKWDATDTWQFKTGTSFAWHAEDVYEGSGRMDLLEENTDSYVQIVKAGISYSTIDSYKRRRAKIPSRVSLEVSDTVDGRNIERQLRTDISAMIFF
jgi:hypothetical protein